MKTNEIDNLPIIGENNGNQLPQNILAHTRVLKLINDAEKRSKHIKYI